MIWMARFLAVFQPVHTCMHGRYTSANEEFGTKAWMCPTLSKLGDDTEFLVCLEGVEHLYDVFVPEAPQYLNLLSQADYVPLTLAKLQNELHSHGLPCPSSAAFVDLQTITTAALSIFFGSPMYTPAKNT